jgi:hypothetical protein
VVLNATNTDGLASQTRTQLENKHVNVTAIGDATTVQTTTTVIDNSNDKMPATHQLLKSLYGNNFTTVNPYSSAYTANFIVVVGANASSSSTGSSTTQ